MKKLFILLLFLTSLLEASKSKEILLLHSYHKGYTWSDDISKTVEDKLARLNNIELTTVYMDTKRVSNDSYINSLYDLYKIQFNDRHFDLIIASDNHALEFLNKYSQKLFPNTPIIFTGINYYNNNIISNLTQVTGVVEQVDLEKNFSLIKKLQPDLKKLLIINDTSTTGIAIKKDLQPIIKKYRKDFEIEYTDNLDIKELKLKAANLKKDSAILFVLLFKDTTGKYFTYKQSFKQIKEVSNVPMYGLWDFYLNYGIVGGLLTSAVAQGEAVTNMALRVLNGTDIRTIPVLEKSPNRYMFDFYELKRFGIDVDDFVKDYEVINQPHSFVRKYTKLVVTTISIITVLMIMVLAMRANIQRRKLVEKDLQNRIKFDKVLLDTIPNPIYYKNKDGKFLGCNKSFSQLVGMSKKEVIGKTAHDFFSEEIATRNEKIDKEILETLGTNTSEATLHLSNNHMKHIIINKAVYLNNDSSIGGIVCVMDDITERMQQKQFLIQQSKLAEMGDMVAAIAHQWNEPLVELSAQIQDIQTTYILNELKDIDVNDFVNDSMVQIKYMSKTLSDFRNFLKPSTKKSEFPIKASFDDVIEIIGKQIFYSNIELILNYDFEEEELYIYGYENEFKQVLLNLINNAKNKIVEKKDNNKYKITINIFENLEYTCVEIIDDGGKIDDTIIDKIFEPYFTTKKDGTGFGLYMAKVIIEDKMNGMITAKNRDDKVVFSIKLPHNKGIQIEDTTT